jgi:hypothetical protein
MTAPRVRCAAADLWGSPHYCVERWYTVTDPEGRQFDLCSGACLVEYATLGALPTDPEELLTFGKIATTLGMAGAAR